MQKEKKAAALIWKGDIFDALAYFELKSPRIDLQCLIVPVDEEGNLWGSRVPFPLLEAQAESLEISVRKCVLSQWSWEGLSLGCRDLLKDQSLELLAFSDFQRDPDWEKLAKAEGLSLLWPMQSWTIELARNAFLSMGHEALIYESKVPEFLGTAVNRAVLERAMQEGELFFKAFVYNGPFFQRKIALGCQEGQAAEAGPLLLQLLDKKSERYH
ncbi:MAG: hypothetical protein EA369_06845 [Bradymonadales bacterium]|nr:MAG: hypothetical protein EA369_06845 [Bradymonadales bacterium]